ncbi:hypothetical protein [Peptoniphilus phoceensis]|uniref:hypothetical protein n=1 Tax=Peptoniphilus phoceensis TaxID=1720298 RepID=UPI000783F32A|nr:hypothetical protein [Peptoniphilus phoceensis]
MNKIIIVVAIGLIGSGVLDRSNANEAESIGIIGGADGPTQIYTETNKKTDKDKGIEIIGGADGPTQIYTEKKENNDKDKGIVIIGGADGPTQIYTESK